MNTLCDWTICGLTLDSDDYEVPPFTCSMCGQPKCLRTNEYVGWTLKTFNTHSKNTHICRDFFPNRYAGIYQSAWKGMDNFFREYYEEVLNYYHDSEEAVNNRLIYFNIKGHDNSISYGVRFIDFWNGTHIEGNLLKAVVKRQRKRRKYLDGSIGYPYQIEQINGVQFQEEQEENFVLEEE